MFLNFFMLSLKQMMSIAKTLIVSLTYIIKSTMWRSDSHTWEYFAMLVCQLCKLIIAAWMWRNWIQAVVLLDSHENMIKTEEPWPLAEISRKKNGNMGLHKQSCMHISTRRKVKNAKTQGSRPF